MYKGYRKDTNARDVARTCKHKKRSKSADAHRDRFSVFGLVFLRYYYGRLRKKAKSSQRDGEWNKDRTGGMSVDDTPAPKPKPPKEELAKHLVVEDVDLNIKGNAVSHRTDDYAIIQAEVPECVVRRGAEMTMDLKFDRPYEKAKHDLKICLEFGEDGIVMRGTKANMQVDESGKKTFKSDEWGANLVKVEGKGITVKIHIPCDCIIGEWNVSITTKVEGKDKDGKDTVIELVYEHDTDINILFNPFCKDDTAYLPDMEHCKEYVLSDSGAVYQGNAYAKRQKEWTFGQFELGVLDTTLHLIRNSFKPKKSKGMANPIQVSRVLAHAINDKVLFGNWSGDYKGGKEPWLWQGSDKILTEFFGSTLMVRYGQCWVFSGILTTLCRAIGIPCRSVTNYDSAHDTDRSNTIDKYFSPDEDGYMKMNENMTSDSVWNFHVWNEVWFKRPDLEPLGKYDGWQALDSTPQEESDGIFTCGPASLVAVKEGNCKLDFDTGFVFSEVNADEVWWEQRGPDDYVVTRKKKSKIGNHLSTKKCGVMEREDVTHLYKHPEGSEEERQSVKKAHGTAEKALAGVYKINDIKKMKFRLLHKEVFMIGDDLELSIEATNNGRFERKVRSVKLSFEPVFYTGVAIGATKTHNFDTIDVAPGKVGHFHYKHMRGDYLPHLVEDAYIKISMTAIVDGVGDEPPENAIKERTLRLEKPCLTVEAPSSVKNGKTLKVKLSFKNPLPYALTNLVLEESAAAFKLLSEKTCIPSTVGSGELFEGTVELTSLRCKKEATVTFGLSSKELFDICGKATVEITE